MQDRSHSEELCRQPADVDRDHPDGGINPRTAAETGGDDIRDSQTLEFAEHADNENTGKNQTDGGTEGICKNTSQPVTENRCADPHAGTGTEPGGDQSSRCHPQWQSLSCNQKILHVFYMLAGPDPYAQHDCKINGDSNPQDSQRVA